MSEESSTPPPKPVRIGSGILSFFIGLSILLITSSALFYFLVAQPAITPVNRLAEALRAVTNQEVSIEGASITLARAEVRELVVVERRVQSMVKYETKWLGSNKMIIVKGDFLVKAGYDLTEFEGFELQGNQVIGQWPEAKILSVEMRNFEEFFSQNGSINRLKGKDYASATNLLQKQARRDALESSDILQDTERVLRRRLEDISGRSYQWHREFH